MTDAPAPFCDPPNGEPVLGSSAGASASRTSDLVWPLLVTLGFLAIRLPVVQREPGGLDEHWFAVPGYTVSREGIPRIPYCPERNRDSFFWKADVMLFALPPALHYVQAPFFWLFPPGYSTARLASATAGVAALWLLFGLGRRLIPGYWAAVIACGLFSLSRVFFFPAITSRPDMLCCAFGLGAIEALLAWRSSQRIWQLALAGVCLGLAGLSHPFAMVFALQLGVWTLLTPGPIVQRVQRAALLTAVTLAVFALWLPLILREPEIFRAQFFNNVLSRSEPGASSIGRVIENFSYQAGRLWDYAGPVQCGLMGLGMLGGLLTAWFSRDPSRRTLVALTASSVVLLVLLQGRHPTLGYWCYPGGLMFLCLAALIRDVSCWRPRWATPVQLCLAALCALLLAPGAGLRATLTHLRHWNDPAYRPARFVEQVLQTLPADAALTVDPAYVFEVFLRHPRTLLGEETPHYFHAAEFPYDYLLASREALAKDLPRRLNGVRVAQYGNADDPFACVLDVYQSPSPAPHVPAP
jgi:hypothetical protein